jgi:hypothetical protein
VLPHLLEGIDGPGGTAALADALDQAFAARDGQA